MRLTWQTCALQRQGPALAAGPFQVTSVWLIRSEHLVNRFAQLTVAEHLPYFLPLERLERRSQEPAGRLVGKQDRLVGLQYQDPFHHAAKDGAQLLAVL